MIYKVEQSLQQKQGRNRENLPYWGKDYSMEVAEHQKAAWVPTLP